MLIKDKNGKFYAIEARCAHEGTLYFNLLAFQPGRLLVDLIKVAHWTKATSKSWPISFTLCVRGTVSTLTSTPESRRPVSRFDIESSSKSRLE